MTDEVKHKMAATLTHLEGQLAKLHTGRANPSLVEDIQVEAYGGKMRLQEVASISAPQPNLLLVQPWDQTVVSAVSSAIQAANLGLQPQVDGNNIRLAIPPLSQERREQLIKMMHTELEEAKVAIRQLRHEEREALLKAKKAGDISEDEEVRREKELQTETDAYIEKIDNTGHAKEKELQEI